MTATASCACRGYMTQPGTEHTATGCSVVPLAVTEALLAAVDGDRPLDPAERALVDAWVIERGQTPEAWAPVIGRGMADAGPGEPGVDVSRPDDHGIIRRLP